jgi:hypothetical protein
VNIDDAKKNRATLKSYFVKNAIPTEGQFSQFIDSVLNQRDDGLVKTLNDPLSIEAVGDDTTFKKAINFYTRFADPNPAWSIALRPRSNPADPTTGRPGLSINDAAGNSRLCIDLATGNVGIGTIAPDPRNKLQIEGPLHMDGNPIFLRQNANDQFDVVRWSAQTDRVEVAGLHGVNLGFTSGGGATPVTTPVLTVSDAGNVGIGTLTPDPHNKLQVEGPLHMDGNPIFLRQSPTDQFDVIQWNSHSDRVEIGGFNGVDLGYTSGGPAPALKPALSVVGPGNVGIGTTNPAETLDVAGRVKSGGLSVGPWPPNPGGYVFFGTNLINQAAVGNYALLQGASSEPGRTFLNSPVDIHFRINNGDQMILTNNGFVGIGTMAPSQKLDVIGAFIRVSGIGNESVYMGGDGAGNDAQFGSLNSTVTNAAMYNPARGAYMNLFAAVFNPSDIRLKEDVQEVGPSLGAINQLRPVSFYRTSDTDRPDRARQLGLIAQEVQQILPDAVLESGRGDLSINFTAIVTLLVKAVQEQQAKLKELEAALAAGGGTLAKA